MLLCASSPPWDVCAALLLCVLCNVVATMAAQHAWSRLQPLLILTCLIGRLVAATATADTEGADKMAADVAAAGERADELTRPTFSRSWKMDCTL